MKFNDITNDFKISYQPHKALVFYMQSEHSGYNDGLYIESYDFSEAGTPMNAHPLSKNEIARLRKMFEQKNDPKQRFLHFNGIIPENLLHVDFTPNEERVIWYTTPGMQTMFFIQSLGIDDGVAKVPGLVWVASKHDLKIFATKIKVRPDQNTPLFHAPFFNMYKTGAVCLGNVPVSFTNDESLQDFIQKWQIYFWGSRFSHLIDNHQPVKTNIIQLWQQQTVKNNVFPVSVLNPAKLLLKNLLP
ncbi:MAG: hypothetical protein J7502_04715 [Flavisolibacter sp.]|nr:hypothetical protein [Flavisolibacter sp.]